MNKNNGNLEFDLLAIFALGVSIYIAGIGKKNLEYTRINSEISEKIAQELKKLNNSNLIKEIKSHLKKEQNHDESQRTKP